MEHVSVQSPQGPIARIHELDALRGLAAFSVLLRHYTWDYEQLFGHDTPVWFYHPMGNYGVELFFMLSGFVILMTLDRQKSVLDFAASRFARLYPVYWAAVLLTFLVVCVCGLPGKEVTWKAAIINLTMIQRMLDYPDVDAVYWTLLFELQFYVLMGVIMLIGLRSHVTLILGALVGFHWIAIKLGLSAQGPVGSGMLYPYLPLEYLHLFLIGTIFYEMRQRVRLRHVALLILCLNVASHAPGAHAYIVTLLSTLVFLASRFRIPLLANPVLVYLGVISYSLYLLHQNIGYIVIRWGYRVGLDGNTSSILAALLAIGLASVLTFAIERPSNRFLRTQYKSWKTRRLLPVRPGCDAGPLPA